MSFNNINNVINKIGEKGIIYYIKFALRILLAFLYEEKKDIIYKSELTARDSSSFILLKSEAEFIIDNITKYSDMNENHRQIMERTSELSQNEIGERFKKGDKCFIVKDNKQMLVHYSWVCFNKRFNEIINKTIDLEGDEVYIYNSFTTDKYRGLSIYPWVLLNIQNFYRKEGIRSIYIDVIKTNYPSVKGIEKAGFIPIREYKIVRILSVIKMCTINSLTKVENEPSANFKCK